jgi:hypothetical protein
MTLRLFRGVPGFPGLFGRRGRRWGPPGFGRRPGGPFFPGGGLPPLPDEFSPGGPWGGPFGPPGPWGDDLWDFEPGPWGPYPGFDDDF